MAAAVRHSALQAPLSWPFIGREDEFAWVDAARREVEGSHVIMVSQLDAVTKVIITAAAAVDRPAVAVGGGGK